MTLKLLSTADLSATNNCLVYGPTKSQKTRSIITCPNPIVCSTDVGLGSIREMNVPYFPVKTWAEYEQFEKAMLSGELSSYATVILDDLTELGELLLAEEMKKTSNGQKAYGEMATKLAKSLRLWARVEAPFSTVTIAKMEKYVSLSDGLERNSPRIPGKVLNGDLPYLFSQIYQSTVYRSPTTFEEVPCFRCLRDSLNEAGDRSGKLLEFEPLSLGHIFQKTQL